MNVTSSGGERVLGNPVEAAETNLNATPKAGTSTNNAATTANANNVPPTKEGAKGVRKVGVKVKVKVGANNDTTGIVAGVVPNAARIVHLRKTPLELLITAAASVSTATVAAAPDKSV